MNNFWKLEKSLRHVKYYSWRFHWYHFDHLQTFQLIDFWAQRQFYYGTMCGHFLRCVLKNFSFKADSVSSFLSSRKNSELKYSLFGWLKTIFLLLIWKPGGPNTNNLIHSFNYLKSNILRHIIFFWTYLYYEVIFSHIFYNIVNSHPKFLTSLSIIKQNKTLSSVRSATYKKKLPLKYANTQQHDIAYNVFPSRNTV